MHLPSRDRFTFSQIGNYWGYTFQKKIHAKCSKQFFIHLSVNLLGSVLHIFLMRLGGKKRRRIKLKTIFLQQEKIYLSYQEKRTKKIANLFNNNFNYKALIAFVLNTYKYNVSTKHAVTL